MTAAQGLPDAPLCTMWCIRQHTHLDPLGWGGWDDVRDDRGAGAGLECTAFCVSESRVIPRVDSPVASCVELRRWSALQLAPSGATVEETCDDPVIDIDGAQYSLEAAERLAALLFGLAHIAREGTVGNTALSWRLEHGFQEGRAAASRAAPGSSEPQ